MLSHLESRAALRHVSNLYIHASWFVRSFTESTPKALKARAWGPVLLREDLDEVAGYLRELPRKPLAARIQRSASKATELFRKAIPQRSKRKADDAWKKARYQTELLIVALEDARREIEIESPGRMNFLATFGTHAPFVQSANASTPTEAVLAGDKTGKRQGKQPAWQRLVIVKSDTGDDIARLDGKEHRLTGASDATFLELLQKQQGGPILSGTLERSCGGRPARIHARLPKAIQRIIDKPGQRTGKKGYRML